MNETDYKPGDRPVPVGTLVDYFGSQEHGRYEVVEVHDPSEHPYQKLTEGIIKRFYSDGVAYHLWPVGVPRKFGNRDRGVYFTRRTSFRIHEEEDR